MILNIHKDSKRSKTIQQQLDQIKAFSFFTDIEKPFVLLNQIAREN